MASRRDMDPTAFDAEFTPDYRNALNFENSKPFENEAQNSKNQNFDSTVFIV